MQQLGGRQPGHDRRPPVRRSGARRSAAGWARGPRSPGSRGTWRPCRPATSAPRRRQQAAADLRLLHDLAARRRGGPRPVPARDGHRAVHRRHLGGGRARHLPQADRGPDQPGPGDPLGPDPHAGRRPGAGPLLGPRSGLRRPAAAGPAGRDQRGPGAIAPRAAAASRPPSAAPGRPAAQRQVAGPARKPG